MVNFKTIEYYTVDRIVFVQLFNTEMKEKVETEYDALRINT